MENQIVPQHIAIIMDGNRRWAKEHGLLALAGHKKVTDDILEPLIEHAADIGVKHVTFWAWSTENWQRDQREVTGIMKIFKHMINKRWVRLHEKGVRIRVIGDISKFDPEIKNGLEKVMEQTKDNKRITAIFALNYGGRNEILRAVIKLLKSPRLPKDVIESDFTRYLDTAGTPDPEIIVRTGGEQRLSGFLLWQSEYSELFFAPWYMPDFTPEKLDTVIEEFRLRQRRFGR